MLPFHSVLGARAENRKAALKSLIDSIPASREELFKYNIPWDVVDSAFVEKRIRPWVTSQVIKLIGEEEVTLIAFICNKIESKSSAQ